MSIRVVARHNIKPEKLDEFISLMKQLVENTKREDSGVINYGLFQDITDPNCIAMLEEWESEEAIAEHLKKQHFLDLLPAMRACMAGQSTFNNFKSI
ncbi:MAG: antibiotic biosynthesis monooxygenase [Oscillospiraceae bacterium]|nr:antibiotic biosynthesis monooxygenase [Oscillospiraceae bacterium]